MREDGVRQVGRDFLGLGSSDGRRSLRKLIRVAFEGDDWRRALLLIALSGGVVQRELGKQSFARPLLGRPRILSERRSSARIVGHETMMTTYLVKAAGFGMLEEHRHPVPRSLTLTLINARICVQFPMASRIDPPFRIFRDVAPAEKV